MYKKRGKPHPTDPSRPNHRFGTMWGLPPARCPKKEKKEKKIRKPAEKNVPSIRAPDYERQATEVRVFFRHQLAPGSASPYTRHLGIAAHSPLPPGGPGVGL